MQIGVTTMENNMEVAEKIKTRTSPCDLGITLLGIYTKNKETLIQRYTHPIFTAPLFTIAKLWKQSNSPLINEKDKVLFRRHLTTGPLQEENVI